MRHMIRSTLILTCLLAGSLHAASKSEQRSVAFSPAHFAEQRQAILERMRSKDYAELGDEGRAEVLDALERMQGLLEGVTRLEQLDKRDQTAVFNDQELINTLLTEAAEDSRLICKREKFVGSHRTTNVCITVAERRRLAEAAQDQMRGLQGSGYLEPERAGQLRSLPQPR